MSAEDKKILKKYPGACRVDAAKGSVLASGLQLNQVQQIFSRSSYHPFAGDSGLLAISIFASNLLTVPLLEQRKKISRSYGACLILHS